MSTTPLISIITIVYNDKNGLQITANSIISQTAISKTEWILIDANSNDGTKEILEHYKQYTSYAISEPDNGRYDGMNKGIALAKGMYTIFMNAGDIFAEDYVIEKVLKHEEWGKTDYISGNTYYTIGNKIVGKDISPDTINATFFLTGALCHQSTFIKTDRLKEFGGYDERFKITADAKFFYEDIVMRNAKYCKADLFISKFDVTGVSSSNFAMLQEEKMKFISQSLPSRVLKDLNRLAFGETALERISIRLKQKGPIYIIVSLFAIILYSPIALKNRVFMLYKKYRNKIQKK